MEKNKELEKLNDPKNKELYEKIAKEFLIKMHELKQEYLIDIIPRIDYFPYGIAPSFDIMPLEGFFDKWGSRIIKPKTIAKPKVLLGSEV